MAVSRGGLPGPGLRAFADASPDVILGFDGSGRIVFANRRAVEQFGYGAGELLGSPIGLLFTDPGRLADPGCASGLRIELEGRLRQGGTFPAEVSLTPIRSEPPLRIALVRDVSDQRRAEQDRVELLASERRARSDAERASLMKDEFLATLSHELRNPLNAMLGWTQVLQKHGADREIAARAIETIERNVRIQTELIEDLLDMSQIISGKLRLEPKPTSLVSVIEKALETVAPGARNKEILLSRDLDAQVGLVMGDPHRLQQVVWNLLSNAVKFTPRGGQVSVRLIQVGSYARIEVGDTGPGIDPAFLPYLFDRFRQADPSSSRRHGGLGLGLSIVRSLVEMHGGTVQADSPAHGGGSSFVVMLPLSVPGSEPAADEQAGPRERAPAVRLASRELIEAIRGIRVLVVDDQPDARDLLRQVLEDFDVEVFVAASASEALLALAEHRPDALLCDIGMPGEDGYQLIRRVRALDREHGGRTPAAALTAYARKRDRQKALELGFQLHVAKPVDPLRVAEILAQLVETSPPE